MPSPSTEEDRANHADFSSALQGGSNEAEDCVAFERRQSTLRWRSKHGPRARCEVMAKRRDSRQLSSSLDHRLDPEQYDSHDPRPFSSFLNASDIITKKIIFKVARQKEQKAKRYKDSTQHNLAMPGLAQRCANRLKEAPHFLDVPRLSRKAPSGYSLISRLATSGTSKRDRCSCYTFTRWNPNSKRLTQN